MITSSLVNGLFGTMTLKYEQGTITEVNGVNKRLCEILGIGEAVNEKNAMEMLSQYFDFDQLAVTISEKLLDIDSFTTANIVETEVGQVYVQMSMHVAARTSSGITVSVSVIDVTDTVRLISRHSTKLSVIASLSSDILFEYSIKDDLFSISEKNGDDFVVTRELHDFETVLKNEKVICEDDMELFQQLCDSMRLGKEAINGELRLYSDEQCDYIWYVITARTVRDEQGIPVSVIGRALNISHNKNNELMLIDKAERDPLTQIYNKATTRSLIKDYLRSDSRDTYDALIIVDVDNFKQINDNLGHLFGDSILLDLAQEMQDLFRSSDVVGRIGGDEFLVFLRGIKQKQHIEDKASDICKVFTLLYSGEHEEEVTGSLGISIFPIDGDTYDELFRKADIALYSSKNAGKNCYTFYSDSNLSVALDDNQSYVNHYVRDSPLESSRQLFDSKITDFAFDIMNTTKDVSSAINLLMSKVGKHFNLSRVSVLEAQEEPGSVKITYQWCAKNIPSNLGRIIFFNPDLIVQLRSWYDVNDIISIPKWDNDTYPGVKEQTKDVGSQIVALLSSAIYDSGEFKGCICFSDCERERNWTVDEVRAARAISKVVSSYLLKMRAFQKANRMVERLTNFDKLTGLPTFERFKKIVSEILENGSYSKDSHFALASFDVNNFKYVNEKFGLEYGDKLLKSIADSISHLKAEVLCSSRVFSDRFVIFFGYNADQDPVKIMIEYLTDFSAEQKKLRPECTIYCACGICEESPGESADLTVAIDNVNIARKKAKEKSETDCVMYKPEMKEVINRTIEIVNEAKHALINHEFVVYYQPKIGLEDSKLVGAEALIRWKKPDGKIVPPGDFIPYLERNGFVVNVDFYVYEEVCRFIRDHLDKGMPIVPISVNVSRVHLQDPCFLDKVTQLVNKYSIPTNLLEFELTESVFLDNQTAAVSAMEGMKRMGFLVSIDDFGSGFSSLGLLKSLPVDILKIDKEFFSNEHLQQNDQIVISSIISMASRMHISVICEGVETMEQVKFLKENKCDMVQGYFYAKPISTEDFRIYMKNMLEKGKVE